MNLGVHSLCGHADARERGGEAMKIALTEPVAVPELYVDGIASIEQFGPMMRLVFYTLQRPIDGGEHDLVGVVVARFVMRMDAVNREATVALAATDTAVRFDLTH
jgi:hypothetical protein